MLRTYPYTAFIPLTMHSQVTSMTVAQLRDAVNDGNLTIDSDLNRGTDGATVWSEARKDAFIAAKVDGMPSQSITLVQIADAVTHSTYLPDGQWKVLDGRNRLLALLNAFDRTALISLIVELVTVPTSERERIPAMFTALNNGGVPLTPGEALLVAAAPELTDNQETLVALAYKIWTLCKKGRGSSDEPDPHLPESIIIHALWKIRDAIHGPGRDQGQPTLACEHSELFGPGARRDREQGFASLLSLLEFAAVGLGSSDLENVALVFGAAAQHVVSLGERASVLAAGSVCTNVHDKAWLPCNAVIELVLSQSLCPDNPLESVWWRYFAAFLDRCQATPMNELWIQGLVNYEMQRRGNDVHARRRAAGEFSSFARQNCVAPTPYATRGRTPTIHRGAHTGTYSHYRMFKGRRLPTTPDHPHALATDEHRLFHGHRLSAERDGAPPRKLRRANADNGATHAGQPSAGSGLPPTSTKPCWHVHPPSAEAFENAC